MANINSTLKDDVGNNLYPVTLASNVSGLSALLGALASKDASNLTASNIASWLSALNVYSKTEQITPTNVPQTIDAGSTISWGASATINISAENSIRIFYGWFNATTNNKNMVAYDTTSGSDVGIAHMANINGYNQYHLMTVIIPPNRSFKFTNSGIACKYHIYKIT